ncbi:MAG: asparagine synthase (glutamine-hydrolyzing) [Bacteroidetes bacterium]|nr:MAG: asparagine synthase (glutamine-hydrolyzing) [Bacteroidota bacterium]REJ99695.1 MAG: asparagine synthase (glutamine-hydrolyzing) [Bacteroidota bacterium]REK33928.1 MAG: asparagine synthase (glutamine-hydrolyzing) [Bacteroidota bacterium]REK47694.1 MAG: asparagine synthase (glutamine-hydrolyzing) [Bacteroidota bacterium]
MCGISGFIDFNRKSDRDTLMRMSGTLGHRGPDDKGHEFFELENSVIGLGFRRLAIIDLSPAAHQPMYNADNDCWIIFNGEIYNYSEIKAELVKSGFAFHSNSDTEVILKSFQRWGLSFVDKLIGMFAMCLFDRINGKIHFLRDRAGVKPLYYYHRDGLFLFGSELKVLHQHPDFRKELNEEALGHYFSYGYIPAPYSVFQNTYKLKPGHILTLNLASGRHHETKFWDVFDSYNRPKKSPAYEEALERTEELLVSAFNYRMVSDVPVGVFLSGGYDSSCVTALLQKNNTSKIKTYTIGFEDEKYNEAPHAAKVASFLGTDHHEYYCTYREALDLVPELPQIFDEPFGDPSAVPTTLVSRQARKHVTVALSADAGDELFAGYPRHKKSLSLLRKMFLFPSFSRKLLSKGLSFHSVGDLSKDDRLGKLKSCLASGDVVKAFEIINQTYSSAELKELFIRQLNPPPTVFDDGALLNDDNDILSKILAVEYKTYLSEDILHKVDRASMSASLEGRDPFVDHRIVEYVAGLPADYKMSDGIQKKMLKDIVHKHIPESLMNRPKMGFGIPLHKWLRNELKPLFDEHMNDDFIIRQGIFDLNTVRLLRNAYLGGKLPHFEKIWLLFSFQLWYRKWMS